MPNVQQIHSEPNQSALLPLSRKNLKSYQPDYKKSKTYIINFGACLLSCIRRVKIHNFEVTAASIPNGILIKKIQFHDQLSVSHPPKIGPITGATTTPNPKIDIASARFSRGKASSKIA